ncbi:MAG TPA: plasmid pRiA4b ORF-3 family protein, partial [Anaerolineae bacterium]|nr:plasmid pRiA4b ORF-3 family protein [Anaerolineae bacterium]
GRCYGRPTAEGDVQDERCVKLGQVAARAGSRLTYEYDLGDGWMHDVVVERIVPPDPEAQYPVCLAGERACPPEDVGGINGYYDFLDALQNARLAGHASVLEWIGGHFEPDVFDLETVNRRLRRIGQRRRSSL